MKFVYQVRTLHVSCFLQHLQHHAIGKLRTMFTPIEKFHLLENWHKTVEVLTAVDRFMFCFIHNNKQNRNVSNKFTCVFLIVP